MRLNIFRRKRVTSRLAELTEKIERIKAERMNLHEQLLEAVREYKKALRGG